MKQKLLIRYQEDPTPFFMILNYLIKGEVTLETWCLNLLNAYTYPEDSIWRKLLSCIPIIGIVPTAINERSLKKKITTADQHKKVIKCINIKNHYKGCSIIRQSLTVALVSSIALMALSPAIGIGVLVAAGVIGGSFIAYNAYALHKNRELVQELEKNKPLSEALKVK